MGAPKKSKLLIAHEQSVLEVGKYYLVAHAESVVADELSPTPKTILIPVHPLNHKDVHFAVKNPHYHIDGRFRMPKDSGFPLDNGRTNNIMVTARVGGEKDYIQIWDVKIVYRRRKCIRTETGIKVSRASEIYWAFYEPFIGKSCAGRKCPHYSVTMMERDGILECPLHGLIGDLKTMKIIAPPHLEHPLEDKKEKIHGY